MSNSERLSNLKAAYRAGQPIAYLVRMSADRGITVTPEEIAGPDPIDGFQQELDERGIVLGKPARYEIN